MLSSLIIDRHDSRYETLKKGFNLRWPLRNSGADFIYICSSPEEVIVAANDALSKGLRITVRSGGHCYEGLVSNKLSQDGAQLLAIIDLSLMTGMEYSETSGISSPWAKGTQYKFRSATGNQNWDGYAALYKSANRTIPGGSCYSVGSGGHISGGGYGLLSRMHGLTVDWLSGVDILVPERDGKSLGVRHVSLDSEGVDRDLFIACRGAGGGNFGIILNNYYRELPAAPQQAYLLSLTWPWTVFTNKLALGKFLNAYWQWFSEKDAEWDSSDPRKANGGLFSLLKIQHRSTGDINLLIQYTGMDGRIDGQGQADPLINFVNHMNEAGVSPPYVTSYDMVSGPVAKRNGAEPVWTDTLKDARKMDWLSVTQTINGSGANQYGKYKSFYQKGNFGYEEIEAIWDNFNTADNPLLKQALLQIDSYGGCINANDEITNPTSVYQRESVLKAQLQVYWTDPADENYCVEWCRKVYADYFSQQGGKPFSDNGRYQGCYINYPDIDMKYTSPGSENIDNRWLELYYGPKRTTLIKTKNAVDPLNVFRSELSIPLSHP